MANKTIVIRTDEFERFECKDSKDIHSTKNEMAHGLMKLDQLSITGRIAHLFFINDVQEGEDILIKP